MLLATEVESLLEVVDLVVNLDALLVLVLRKLLKVRPDLALTLLLGQ